MTQVVGTGRADNLFKLMRIQFSVNETQVKFTVENTSINYTDAKHPAEQPLNHI